MIDEQANPPRIAQLLLRASLRSENVESISGDLLEEYRAVRRPTLGQFRADLWYTRHVVSVLARLVGPFALALIIARSVLAGLMLFPLSGRWNPSLVPAPNLSLLDALLFLAAGFYAARRTRRVATGILNAGVLSVIDFALFALFVGLMFPTVAPAIVDKPFILVIGLIFLVMAIAFALTIGAVGAVAGRWTTDPLAGSA